MASELERRVQAMEDRRDTPKSAATMTDRELLSIVAPEYTGPMPSPDELPAMIHAWLMRPGLSAPSTDGVSAEEQYMRMLDGPGKGARS